MQSREVIILNNQIAKLRTQKAESLTNAISPQIKSTKQKKKILARELAKKRSALDVLDKSSRRLKELRRSRDIIETNYVKYKEKAEDFRITDALSDRSITSVRITGIALPPEKPVSPWTTLILALAAFLGLFMGFVYSTLSEFFDHSFTRKNEVESVLGIPLLATIPDLKYQDRLSGRVV